MNILNCLKFFQLLKLGGFKMGMEAAACLRQPRTDAVFEYIPVPVGSSYLHVVLFHLSKMLLYCIFCQHFCHFIL